MKSKKRVFTSRLRTVAHQDLAKGGHNWGCGPQPPTDFYNFNIKNTHFSTLFFEKRRAMSAVITNNAKIFSQLMSKSRNLAKISEKGLQPLLV